MTVHVITVSSHTRNGFPIYEAYAGYGLNEHKSIGCSKWDAVGFLVDDLLRLPDIILANSVDVIDIKAR